MRNTVKKIPSFSIILSFVCLSTVGIALAPLIIIKLSPSKTLPQINIEFSMYGNSPRSVETEATSKLESMLARISGVQRIISKSGNGYGAITMELDKHVDIELCRFEVATIIRQIWPQLPHGVTYPKISQSFVDQNSERPFLNFTVNSTIASQDIQDYVETKIKPKLSIIEGIDKVQVSGAIPIVWMIKFDPILLIKHKIQKSDIQKALSGALEERFMGMVFWPTANNLEEWVKVSVEAIDREALNPLLNIQVKNINGNIIPLKKIASFTQEELQPNQYFRINGLNSIYLSITASEKSNQLELSKRVKKEISQMQGSLPDGFEIHNSYDATEYLKDELEKMYFRTGLTLFLLLLFVLIVYRNFRHIALILISLSINLSIAIIGYYFLKLEIQLYSLVGLTISLTLLLDNTIVMVDHVIRNKNTRAFIPILAATITTIGALSSVFLMEEKIRLSLEDFAAVIIVNLLISLPITLFLVPALIDKLSIRLKNKSGGSDIPIPFKSYRWRIKWLVNPFTLSYRLLHRWRICIFIIIILTFGLPVFLLPDKIEGESRFSSIYNSTIGTEYYKKQIAPYINNVFGGTLRLFVEKVYAGSYFSEPEETSLTITSSLPSNSTMQEMNGLIQQMESYLCEFTEIKQFQTNIYNSLQASINIQFKKEYVRGNFPHLLKANLISKSLTLGGGSWAVYGIGDGFNNEARENAGTYKAELFGYNYDELITWSEKFKDKLLKHKRIKDVTIESEFSRFKDDYEEFQFEIEKEILAVEDISPNQLFGQLDLSYSNEIYALNLTSSNGIEAIYLKPLKTKEQDIWGFLHSPVKFNEKLYKLSELTKIKKVQQPKEIGKWNQQYRLCLQYEYVGAYEQGKKLLENYIKEYKTILPLGYTIKNATTEYGWHENSTKQYYLLLLIFVIIYFVASIFFNSLRQSLYIIFVIPISFIGIFLIFYFFGLNFDQGGFASFILLSGLTINSNLYILNEYNDISKRNPKFSPVKVYLSAWNNKVQPILLTVISTILGFIPFLVGETKEAFWYPLAAGTIGGLLVSTLATFFLLPLFMGIGKVKSQVITK